MKKKLIFFITLLILSLALIAFWQSPSLRYRTFPQALIALRRAGAFSAGYEPKDEDLLVTRRVLGVEDFSVYSQPYPSVAQQTSPLTFETCQEQLSSWLNNQYGRWGVVIYDIFREEKFVFQKEEKFHAASVMKLATAVSVFEWMEETQNILESWVWGQSLEQRLTLLINQSDNYQWADLGALVNLSRTQRILEENGLRGSDIYTNTMTAEDVFLLLQKIYNQELLTEEQRQFLFSIMQNTINETRIPKGIPEEVPVAHKYGTWQANIHDAGIVFFRTPYILVVLTNSVSGAETKIAEFSSQVYQMFSQGQCSPK